MSPEQSAGDGLDERSDVYSLGCVLYEMLAGEPPFAAPTAAAVLRRRFSEAAPLVRRVRPDVPVSIEGAIARAFQASTRFCRPRQAARSISNSPNRKSKVCAPLPCADPPAGVGEGSVDRQRLPPAPENNI
jgi:serine/threonine protein kinase